MKFLSFAVLQILLVLLWMLMCNCMSIKAQAVNAQVLCYEIDPKADEIVFFWRDSQDRNYGNFQTLKDSLSNKGQNLLFAMNGGMYLPDGSPQGLYIENGKILSDLDTVQLGYGNFYMQPNGVFYLEYDGTPVICKTWGFKVVQEIKYATQSGPMLLIDGAMHPRFRPGSPNVHIRNGVGVLPNGKLLFAMSKVKVNFYDFASFFKSHGCKSALYLDGFVSRTYLPSKDWEQLDGNFGVIIGQVREKDHYKE